MENNKLLNILWKGLTKDDISYGKPHQRIWYFENISKNNTLLITVGDSWTWGDSLGKTSVDPLVDDYEHRTTHIYGSLLATRLNADHVNIAIPGGTNIFMHEHLIEFLPHVVKRYEKIYVIVTLTEICREIIVDPLWNSIYEFNTLNQMLQAYEENMFNAYSTNLINRWPEVTFLIGRNFTESFSENIHIIKNSHLEKTWVEQLAVSQDITSYPQNVRFLTGMALSPLITHIKQINKFSLFKQELFDYYAVCLSAIDWLDKSVHNYNKASRHPTESGHQIWADYLYNIIKQK